MLRADSDPGAALRALVARIREEAAVKRNALACDIDLTMEDAFGFDGARCDRIVAEVIKGLGLATSAEIRS